jgi:hypothetical protein
MSNFNLIIGGLSICLGIVVYKNCCSHKFFHSIDIPLYEINNILSKEELKQQFERDNLRYNLDFDVEKIISLKPQLKIFFTQTVYNYIYHFYLVPNLIKKKYNIFDKTSVFKKNSMSFENDIFSENRVFQIIKVDTEKVISSIETSLIYKYPSNIITLNINYISNKQLFNFFKSNCSHIV